MTKGNRGLWPEVWYLVHFEEEAVMTLPELLEARLQLPDV